MSLNLNTTSPRSIKLMFLISKIGFFASLVFALIISTTLILSFFGVGLPVKSDVTFEGVSTETRQQIKPSENIKKEEGAFNNKRLGKMGMKDRLNYKHLYFQSLPTNQQLLILSTSLCILYLLTCCTFYFKRFMHQINQGDYFKGETIKNIRLISYLLFSVWLIKTTSSLVVTLCWGESVLTHPVANIHIATNFPSISVLISACIFWILSHIFLHGARIEKEHELTI